TQRATPEAQRGARTKAARRQRAHRSSKKSARGPGAGTARERRRRLMDLVEDFAEPGVPVVAACAVLGLSRATVYRGTAPTPPPTVHATAVNPRRLGDDERQAIVDTMHSAEFVDQTPIEVFATLLGRGIYLASIRTIYRVLAELGETKERRNQRLQHSHVKPTLTATAPGQVWTWDITKLATLQRGVF